MKINLDFYGSKLAISSISLSIHISIYVSYFHVCIHYPSSNFWCLVFVSLLIIFLYIYNLLLYLFFAYSSTFLYIYLLIYHLFVYLSIIHSSMYIIYLFNLFICLSFYRLVPYYSSFISICVNNLFFYLLVF